MEEIMRSVTGHLCTENVGPFKNTEICDYIFILSPSQDMGLLQICPQPMIYLMLWQQCTFAS